MSIRRLIAATALVLATFPAAAAAEFSSTPDNAVGTNGSVHAVAIGPDGRTYLGGSFNTVGPVVGAGIGFDTTLATQNTALAEVSGGSGNTEINGGQILDAVPDGSGGWYVGGTFGTVGGVTRNNLAHILPSGRVDPNFDPEPDGPVQYLALHGSTLYFTGKFSNVGTTARTSAAAVNATTGALLPWDPKDSYGDTMCGLQTYGSDVFICDYFSSSFGTGTNSGFSEVDGSTGAFIWSPARKYSSGAINSIYISSSGLLYVDGGFNFQEPDNSYADSEFGAFQIPSGGGTPTVLPSSLLNFYDLCGIFSCPPIVSSMDQVGNTLYLGGQITEVDVPDPTPDNPNNSTPYERSHGAALDVSQIATAQPTVLPWDPQASDNINSLAAEPSGDIVVGGNFGSAGGATRGHLAVLDPTTGDAVGSTDPQIDGNVNTVAAAGSAVYAGGAFSIVHGAARTNLAVVNADGTLSSLDPSVDGEVDALAVNGSTLYAGGQFRNATGVGDTSSTTRSYLADFSTSDGSLGTFDPEPDGGVNALATDGTNLYAGGSFSHLNGTAHGNLAAFALGDGSLVSGFDPAPNGTVDALAIGGTRLYAAGDFGSLTGETGAPGRSHVAAFDLSGLSLDAFDPPSIDGTVDALAANESTVYAGGQFDDAGATYRPRLVALDGATGALTSWDPQMGGDVFALALDGSTLYAGGSFTYAGGAHESGAAGLDTTTGTATSFAPNTDYSVEAVAAAGSELTLGGMFQQLGPVLSPGFASFGAGGPGGTSGSGGTTTTLPSDAAGLTPAPDTIITDGPDYATASRRVTFTFTSDTANATFQCSLDGGAFFACSSSYTTADLGYGSHTFLVRAVSPSGAVDSGGASESFVVVTPGVLTTSLAPGAPVLGNVSVTHKIKLGASLRGKQAPGFRYRVNSAATVAISLTRKAGRRWVDAGSLASVRVKAGTHLIRFSGAVSGGEAIAGRYRAAIVAYSATGAASEAATVSFNLIKPPHSHPRKNRAKKQKPRRS
jgi:hypothetical protein